MLWLTYFLGLGYAATSVEGRYNGPDFAPVIDAGAAYRLDDSYAVGLHLRGSRIDGTSGDRGGSHATDRSYEYTTIDIAAAARLGGGRGRVWAEPWLGARVVHGTGETIYSNWDPEPEPPNEKRALWPSPRATVGLLVGVDALTIHGSHRLTVFGEVQVVFPYVEPYLYEQASAAIGIAIRGR